MKAREETDPASADPRKIRSTRSTKGSDGESGSDEESVEDDRRWKGESRTQVSNLDAGINSTYPPRQVHQQQIRKPSIDSLKARPLRNTTERNEETSSEASEGSSEGEAASLLSGVRGYDEDIEMNAGHGRGRTKVTTRGGPGQFRALCFIE